MRETGLLVGLDQRMGYLRPQHDGGVLAHPMPPVLRSGTERHTIPLRSPFLCPRLCLLPTSQKGGTLSSPVLCSAQLYKVLCMDLVELHPLLRRLEDAVALDGGVRLLAVRHHDLHHARGTALEVR